MKANKIARLILSILMFFHCDICAQEHQIKTYIQHRIVWPGNPEIQQWNAGDTVFISGGTGSFGAMATRNQQHYHFIFVHEDGEGLQKVSRLFTEKRIPASVDDVFGLDNVNQALKKVASGGSKGKTILKINS